MVTESLSESMETDGEGEDPQEGYQKNLNFGCKQNSAKELHQKNATLSNLICGARMIKLKKKRQ